MRRKGQDEATHRRMIEKLVLSWLENGHEVATNGWPAHPELLYRLAGEWRGWNHLLTDHEELDSSEERAQTDIEHAAYERFLVAFGVVLDCVSMVREMKGESRVAELHGESRCIRDRRMADRSPDHVSGPKTGDAK